MLGWGLLGDNEEGESPKSTSTYRHWSSDVCVVARPVAPTLQVPFSPIAVPADGGSSSSSTGSSSNISSGEEEEEGNATWTSLDAASQKRRSRRALDLSE